MKCSKNAKGAYPQTDLSINLLINKTSEHLRRFRNNIFVSNSRACFVHDMELFQFLQYALSFKEAPYKERCVPIEAKNVFRYVEHLVLYSFERETLMLMSKHF